MSSTYLTRTAGAPTLNTKYTISVWLKGFSSTDVWIIDGRADANNRFKIQFQSSGKIESFNSNGGSDTFIYVTNAIFRDTNAWYHLVQTVDTTQATASDRVKFYINGERITSFASSTNPPQNDANNVINENGNAITIGSYYNGSSYLYKYDGLMSHFHFIDGYAYDADTFGSTDSTTGEWKINTSPSITMGNNGFTILKDGNTITDQSSNSNDFTLGGGTLTNTEDCPSNNFATFNPLIRTPNGSFSQGNNTFTDTSNNFQTGFSSIGMLNGQGKYYAEFKVASGGNVYFGIADYKAGGVIDRNNRGQTRYLGQYSNSYGYQMGGTFYYNGSSTGTGYDAYTTSNVIGVAVDMDNLKIYFHKDGVYQGSANPASNNGYTIVAPEGAYHMATAVANSVVNANFGNGTFGTTAISSEGTNASGIGKFEYDVPTGYTALSTKGLNE